MARNRTSKPIDPLLLARQAVIEILQSPDATASEKIAAANFIEKTTPPVDKARARTDQGDQEKLTLQERAKRAQRVADILREHAAREAARQGGPVNKEEVSDAERP